jgi:hypothetical protein
MKRPVIASLCTALFLLSHISHSQVFALKNLSLSEEITSLDHRDAEEPYTLRTTSYDFGSLEDELEAINSSNVRRHRMDMEVAKRLHLFEETYVYYSEAAPGAFSDKKVIRKPVIYKSIGKIDKYFRKQVRTGEITNGEASDELSAILDTAIILFYYDTDEFDQLLKGASSVEEEVRIFRKVKLVDEDI